MIDPLEVICSVVAAKIAQRVINTLIEKYTQHARMEEKLQQLRQLLITIHSTIEAAQGCAISNSWLLRWLRDLEDAACHGRRALRDLTQHTEEVTSSVTKSSDDMVKRIRVATSRFLVCNTAAFHLAGTVKKLEKVAATTARFIEYLRVDCSQPAIHQPIFIYMSMHNRVVGRFEELEQTVSWLLKPPHMTCPALHRRYATFSWNYVLAIVGSKGMGKTTLARLICRDERVRKHFPLIMWLHCGPEFSIAWLFRSLREQVEQKIGHRCARSTCQPDRDTLLLAGKRSLSLRFLVILDGIHTVEYSTMNAVEQVEKIGAEGSKIILTTSDVHETARIRSTAIQLASLKKKDMESLLLENALRSAHPEEYRNLILIGSKIADSLRGHNPLAAKTISGTLRDNLNEKYWDYVLTCCHRFSRSSAMVSPLVLSYKLLPAHLQQCFAFLGTYPLRKFTRENLTSLWMRNGIIADGIGNKSAANVAADCFDDLVTKAFIQPSNEPDFFTVHDMLRDVALYVSSVPLPKPKCGMQQIRQKSSWCL